MTAHILVPSLDPDFPATLSPTTLTGLLRNELGFGGVIITDSMAMAAIADNFTVPYATVQTVRAGADLVLTHRDFATTVLAYESLVRAVESGDLPISRLDDAVTRVLHLKENRNWFLSDRIGSIEHAVRVCHDPAAQDMNRRVVSQSVAVVRNTRAFPLAEGATTLVTGPGCAWDLGRALAQRDRGAVAYEWLSASQENGWSPDAIEIERARELAQRVDTTIVLTFAQHGALPAGQIGLIDSLRSMSRTIVVDLGLPSGSLDALDVDGHILTFAQARRPDPLPALIADVLADILTGRRTAAGHNPFRASSS